VDSILPKVLCFVLDPWWNPLPKSKELVHRIGQLNKVNVVDFKNTVEEKSFGYRKTKLLSDALLDETHQP
jgi:SNF2 family DNA or RNA helicase